MRIQAGAIVRKQNLAKIGVELSNAIAISVPLLIAAQPGAAMAALSASAPAIIGLVSALYGEKGGSLSNSAWTIVSSAYALAIAKLIAVAPISRRPIGTELETLVSSMLNRAQLLADDQPQELSLDSLYSPLKIPFIRDAAKALPHELSIFSIESPIGECRAQFESCMLQALSDVRNLKPEMFAAVEQALAGPYAQAIERRKALGRHHEFIIRSFTQRPIFGQEDSGITLEDLYVRQRALWNTRVPRTNKQNPDDEGDFSANFFQEELKKSPQSQFPLHVGDLHQNIIGWLSKRDPLDPVRVVGGGPGSGKSTFARALAIEVIDHAAYDVLFVPLQEIEATGSFQSRIENLFRNRTDLGLDRAENPLNWLGQRDPDGNEPDRPLLIICDGLDEIAPPGSSEAATVTTDFIQALGNWLSSRNSGGHFVSAIVLGRTISAQEAFRKLGVNHHALIRVGGLLPLNRAYEWMQASRDDCLVDPNEMSLADQREDFWANWCTVKQRDSSVLPEALQGDTGPAKALEELTAEPLLLYLLLWTGYLDTNWEKAAANRNHVYEAIFQQIYERRWGQERGVKLLSSMEQGGHTGTRDLEVADFFLLQEALGLASWATGGRTVTSEAFQPMLKVYLGADKYDDLGGSVSGSLKSVALQSYTRSVSADNAGFEFVHKSIGEYLIARGLASWLERSVSPLDLRVSDARCGQAAKLISRIFWRGSLTAEIARFYEDEIQIRYDSSAKAKDFLQHRLIPVFNWILKYGVPIHTNVSDMPNNVSFSFVEQSEKRSLDVFWTGLQCVAKKAFPLSKFGEVESAGGWNSGPISIEWYSSYGFISFVSKLTSQVLISESNRIAPFNYLDLTEQSVTDAVFGAVMFTHAENSKSAYPLHWLPFSFLGANLEGLQFYGANLSKANLQYANLSGTILSGANLRSAQLDKSLLINADLMDAVLNKSSLVDADLTNCRLGGARLSGCDLTRAKLSNCNLIQDADKISRNTAPTVFNNSTLIETDFSGSRIGGAVFSFCDASGADFSQCDLGKAIIIETNFSEASTDTPIPPNWRAEGEPGALVQSSEKENKVPVLLRHLADNVYVYLLEVE